MVKVALPRRKTKGDESGERDREWNSKTSEKDGQKFKSKFKGCAKKKRVRRIQDDDGSGDEAQGPSNVSEKLTSYEKAAEWLKPPPRKVDVKGTKGRNSDGAEDDRVGEEPRKKV